MAMRAPDGAKKSTIFHYMDIQLLANQRSYNFYIRLVLSHSMAATPPYSIVEMTIMQYWGGGV